MGAGSAISFVVPSCWGGLSLGVCLVRFRSVCIGMANQNRIFQFVKFSTETDRNGWKTIGFDVYRFQSVSIGFRFSKERVIKIFKTLNLITYKKQIEQQREKELLNKSERQRKKIFQQYLFNNLQYYIQIPTKNWKYFELAKGSRQNFTVVTP